MKMFLLSLVFFFSLTVSLAQVSSISILSLSVQGTVVDSLDQHELGYVTVAVLETGTNQPLISTFTKENGNFLIAGLSDNQYKLIFACVGYKTKIIKLPALSPTGINLGQIVLSPTVLQLQEVQVLASRPLIEQDLDKLTYHVEADPESHTLSALDMLRKVPMLSIDGEGFLLLNGSESYQVLINGKTSSLFVQDPSEVFRSLPANAIKRIEIMTNPPARYDAEGVGGIINIVMHRNSINGYNGSVNAAISSPRGTSWGSNLSAKAGKFGFSGSFADKSSISPTSISNYRRVDRIRQNSLEQNGEGNSHNNSRFLSGELSYELSQHSLFSINYRVNTSTGQNQFVQEVELLNNARELTQAYRNLNSGVNYGLGNDLGIDYQHNFKKNKEQLLSLSYKINNNGRESSTDFSVDPVLNYTRQVSQTENNNNIREQVIQVDYVHPIKKQTLELGVKSIQRLNTSDYFYQRQEQTTGAFVLDPKLSNNFDYRQNMHAAYVSLNLKKNNWALRSGFRLEETGVSANFRSSGTTASQKYLNLIPNLNLSHKLAGSSNVRLSYTQRLERPSLYYLDPYVNQTDPRNISFGNPELNPATNHVFNLAFSTFQKSTSLNASIFHNFTNNSIQRFSTLGVDTVVRSTFGNIGRSQTTGLTLSSSTTFFKKLSVNLNSTGNYVRITSMLKGLPQHNEGLSLNMSGNFGYRFDKGWRAGANTGINSPRIMLQGKSSGYVWSSLSLNKEVLNNKGNFTFSVSNPFQKHRRFYNEIYNTNFYQLQESYSVIRQFNLSFNYRFGKIQGSAPRKKRSLQQEE